MSLISRDEDGRPHACQNGRHQHVDRQVWARTPRKGDPVHCRWDCKTVRPPRNPAWRVLRHQNPELPCQLVVPVLGLHHEKQKTLFRKHSCTSVLAAAPATSDLCPLLAKKGKRPVSIVGERIKGCCSAQTQSRHSQQRGRTSGPLRYVG